MNPYSFQAERDFNEARWKAFLNEVSAFISRRPNELLSYDVVRRALPIYGSSYRGVQQVPVDKIVGTTTNRYYDFDRAFLPAQARTKSRWKRIDELRLRDETLPPVLLYKVGDMYFVRDGHHRVSVARQNGQLEIDAEVVEMRTRVPPNLLHRRLDSSQLEALGEYATFLEKTQLDKLRPGADIKFSRPGGYARLLEHIIVHQYFMGLDYQRDISWQEAVADWYDTVYEPLVRVIRERRILDDFPTRTEADLYLWIIDHHYYLSQQDANDAHDVTLDHAAQDYVRHHSPRLSRKLARQIRKWIAAWRGANPPDGAPPPPAPPA